MKKTAKICVAVLSLSALTSLSAYAATPGAYAGLGLGYGKQATGYKKDKDLNPQLKQSANQAGIAGRLFVGYNLNKYFGVEAGVNQYSNSSYSSRGQNVDGIDTNNHNSPAKFNAHTVADAKLTTFDLVGKAYLPIKDSGFNLYALGGAALEHSSVTISGHSKNLTNNVVKNTHTSSTANQVRPVAGAGLSYDIPNTQLTTSLEYSHTFGSSEIKNSNVPSADLVTVNLAYNFG